MKIQIPTGLTALLASFEQVLIACHLPEQQSYLSPSFQARLAPAHERLAQVAERHAEQKRRWSLALAERRRHQSVLTRLVRDSWIMLKRRDQREPQAGVLLACFRMPSLAPQHASALEWLEHGRNLLAGEQRATAAGHAPMAFPTAAELSCCLEAATRAESVYAEHLQVLRLLDNELREAQRHATHTLRCLAARLRESQFDQRPEQARALLRSFGFRFKASASDTAEAHAELARAEAPSPEGEPEPVRPEPASSWAGWVNGVKRLLSAGRQGTRSAGNAPGPRSQVDVAYTTRLASTSAGNAPGPRSQGDVAYAARLASTSAGNAPGPRSQVAGG